MDEEKENQKRGQNTYIPLEGLKRWRRSTFKPSTRRSLMIPDEDQVPESLSSDRDVKHSAKYSAPNQGPSTVSHQETGGILSHGKQTEDIFSNVRNINYLRRRSGCTPSQGRSGRVNEKCFNAEVMRQEQSYISYISNRLRCIDDNLPSPGGFMNTCGERQDKMDSTESFYPGGLQQKTNHLLLQRLQYAENVLPEHNNHYNLRSSTRPEFRNHFHSSGISTQFGNSNQNLMYKEDGIDREGESGSNRKENIETRRRRTSNDRVQEEMESGSVKQKYRDNWMGATTSGATQSKDFKHTRDQEEVQFNSTSKASLHESSARPKDDIIRKHATPYHSEFRKRQERLEKFRHIYERRQLALRSSGKTSKAKMTPLRSTLKRRAGETLYRSARGDMKRQRDAEDAKHSVRETSAKSKATQDTAASSQCCRALQFESGDEDGSNDDTAPLAMVDATSVISCTSVLQGHEPKTEPGRVHPPTIKDNLLALPNAKIELKNRNIKVMRGVASSRELNRNGNQVESENFSTNMAALEEELSQSEADMLNNEDNKVQAGTSANKKALLKEKLTKAVGFNVDGAASQNVNSNRHNPSVKSLSSRRRSALVQRPLTPSRHYSSKGQRAVSSIAKLPVTRASKIGAGLGRPELRRRVNNTRRSLRRSGITEDSLEGPQCQGTPTIVLTEPSPPRFERHPERTVKSVKTSDASTNTTIRVLQSRSPRNLNVMKEIDDLVKQHEEIGKKIEEINERTLSRRKRMKETGILESFETSISPLKRLKVMLKDKGSTRSVATSVEMDSQSAVNKSFQNVSMNLSTTQCFSADTSLENCSSLNTTCNLNASQSHWNHLKLENRFLRTPSNPSMRKVPPSRASVQKGKEEEESFREVHPQELSPMVASEGGDGERPSLAPMTPHSRKQVSLLKLSLRKQLEQLYDDKLVT